MPIGLCRLTEVPMDVAAWLRTLGLDQYERPFCENHIDEAVLPELRAALDEPYRRCRA